MSRSWGRSLVELLIALAVGAVVLTLALIAVAQGARASRTQEAASRLDEDAQAALSLLAAQLRLAGYSPARRAAAEGVASRHYEGPPLAVCAHGFAAPNAKAAELRCASGAASASFVVFHEADTFTTWPGTSGLPTNCLGNKLATVPSALGADWPGFALAENRFHIALHAQSGEPTLYCSASSDGESFASQPLVAQVERMELLLGVQPPSAQEGVPSPAVLLAPEVFDASYADDVRRWQRVTHVRLCLRLRSAPGALPEGADTRFVDCDGTLAAAPDPASRRLRRAVHATVRLRNAEAPA